MSRYRIISASWIVGMFLLAPLAALPFDGQAWELKPKIDLSRAHASFWGERTSDRAGISLAIAGDVNGDGFDDIVVGAWTNSEAHSSAGQVYLIFGRASGFGPDLSLSKADASFWGEDLGDYLGGSVAAAGDVNGDGYDDIVVGAPYDDDAHSDSGQVYLIFGKPSGWAMDTDLSTLTGTTGASFWGEDAGDCAGFAVSGAGDVNNDGYDDVLIGVPYNDDGGGTIGQTYLIFGKSSGWSMDTDLSGAGNSFRGEAAADYSGQSVAGVGDVNRDGYDDFLITAPMNDWAHGGAGQAYLIFGRSAAYGMDNSLAGAGASFLGEDLWDYLGYPYWGTLGTTVAGAGDVNGDGYDDFLIGVPYDSDAHSWASGQVYLILGKASGWALRTDLSASSASFWGEDANDYAGDSVSSAGDVNRDGYDDFLIGASADSDAHSSAGQVYLILGKPSGWAMDRDLSTAEASFLGEDAGDYCGFVAGGGDVNGDGYDDFIMSGWGDDDAGSMAGQVYIIMPFAAPPAAKSLTATLAPSLKYINLTWDAATPWNAPITGYRVYRSTDGSHYTDVAFRGPSDRSYSDSNLTYGRTYHYIVITVDGNGDDSFGTSMVSLVCDRDTDNDGIGDLADWDDDGDGYVDGSDAFPLNSAEWLDTDLDGTGNNADTDDDNDGILDTSDARPLDPVNGLWDDIKFMNSTLRSVQTLLNDAQAVLALMNGNLTALSANLNAVNASLARTVNEMNATLRSDIAGARNALSADITDVEDMVIEVSGDLEGMNESVLKNLSEVEDRLRADLNKLAAALDAVNASLHEELAGMEADIAGFRSMMASNLTTIYGRMDKQDANLSRDVADILGMLNGLNATSLASMKQLLTELQTRTDLLDTNLSTKVTDFRDKTMVRLDNVSKLMATIESINSLTTEVKFVQGQAKDIKNEQESTSKKVADLNPPAWGAMIIIIVVLVLAILLLLGSRKGKNEPAQVVEMEPPRQAPPPPISPGPMPPLYPVPPPEGKFHN